MYKVIDLIDIKISASQLLNFLVQLVLHLWEDFWYVDGGIDLLVPILDFSSLLFGEAVGNEIFKEASGSLHVVVFPGISKGDVEQFFGGLVASHTGGEFANLNGLLLLGLIDFGHLGDVNLGHIEAREGEGRQMVAKGFVVSCANDHDPVDHSD